MCFKQRCVSGGKLSAAKVLSTMNEIGAQLFATLEAHFTVDMDDGKSSAGNSALILEQQEWFHERLNSIITSLELSESSITEKEQVRSPSCRCEHKVVVWPQISRYQSLIILTFCVLCLGYFVSFLRTLMFQM